MNRRLLLPVLVLILGLVAFGQTETTVAGTLVGTTPNATIQVVAQQTFTLPDGDTIPQYASFTAVIQAGGAFSISLPPNVGSTPTGTYYLATYYVSTQKFTEIWIVPQSSSPVTLAEVRTLTPPSLTMMFAFDQLNPPGGCMADQFPQWTGTGWTCAQGSGTGTVTSVGLGAPSSLFTVSGSPVTTSGTLGLSLASQTANQVFAAPNGSAGVPAFRAIALADLPGSGAATINTTSPLGGGGSLSLGGSLTLTCTGCLTAVPAPTASTLGGAESYTAPAHEWLTALSTSGTWTASQPGFGDLSGSPTAAQIAGAGTLSNPTTGNAGTATALAATPTLCASGEAAQGVLASGDATGCFTPSGGSGGMANPMTATGDLIVGGTSGAPARLALGASGDCLTSNGTTDAWATCAAGSSVTLETNGTDNASQTALNLLSSTAFNGLTATVTNTAGSSVQLGLSGALGVGGGGTGITTVPADELLYGAGASALVPMAWLSGYDGQAQTVCETTASGADAAPAPCVNTQSYSSPTLPYTVAGTDRGSVLSETAAGTFTLPQVAAGGIGQGYFTHIANTGTANGTLSPNSTDSINGGTAGASATIYPQSLALAGANGGTSWSLLDAPLLNSIGNLAPAPVIGAMTANLTGCATAGYVLTPAGDDCVAQSAGGGATAWSAITAPAAALSLAMAGYTSTFDYTSALASAFTFANTTAATSTVSQSSPVLDLCGQGWEGATAANTQDCFTLQDVIPAGANSSPTLTLTDSGASTGMLRYSFGGGSAEEASIQSPDSLDIRAGAAAGSGDMSVTFFSGPDGNVRVYSGVADGSNNDTVQIGDPFNAASLAGTLAVAAAGDSSYLANSALKATAALTAGEVVKMDTANADSVVAAGTADGAGTDIGFVTNAPAAGAQADVAMPGSVITTPKLGTGTCAIGNFVIADTTTAGDVKCTAAYAAGTVLGYAMTAQATVGGTVTVYVEPR